MTVSNNKRKELEEIRIILQKALERVDAILANSKDSITKNTKVKKQILTEPLIPTGKPLNEKK